MGFDNTPRKHDSTTLNHKDPKHTVKVLADIRDHKPAPLAAPNPWAG
jgi:hypothetical protein